MVQRSKRSEHIPEPAGVMRALGECRAVLIDRCAKVRPMSPAYHALSVVVAAIDALAKFINGHPAYFSGASSYMGEDERRAYAERHLATMRDTPGEGGR